MIAALLITIAAKFALMFWFIHDAGKKGARNAR